MSFGADRGKTDSKGRTAEDVCEEAGWLKDDPELHDLLRVCPENAGGGDEDGALAFAEEDEALARRVAEALRAAGARVMLLEGSPGVLRKARNLIVLLTPRFHTSARAVEAVKLADGARMGLFVLYAEDKTAFPPEGPVGAYFCGQLYEHIANDATFAKGLKNVAGRLLASGHRPPLTRTPVASNRLYFKLTRALEVTRDYAEVERIVRSKVDVNLGALGALEGALHMAAKLSDPRFVRLLCSEGGANVALEDADGRQALHVAAEHGGVEVVRALISLGADPNARPPLPVHAVTPLVHAVRRVSGPTPPSLEAAKDALAVVELLLSAGAIPGVPMHDGTTALDRLAAHEPAGPAEEVLRKIRSLLAYDKLTYLNPREASRPRPKRFDAMISYQWNVQPQIKELYRHLTEDRGLKVWLDIAEMGTGEALFAEIDAGIRGASVIISCITKAYAKSPNCQKEVSLFRSLGKPAVFVVFEEGAWPPEGLMASLLADEQGKPQLQASEGNRAISDRVTALLAELAVPAPQADAGNLAPRRYGVLRPELLKAAEEGRHGDVVRLIREGADPDVADVQWSWTPLMWAVYGGFASIVEYLTGLEARCDTNVMDKYGKTALHVAAKNGRADIAEFLIMRGSDVASLSTVVDAWTPLTYAAYYVHYDVVKLLIENGADVDQRDNYHKRAVDYCKDPGMIRFLEDRHGLPSGPPQVDADVFLSSTPADKEIADALVLTLEKAGYTVFSDENAAVAEGSEAVRQSSLFVLFVSDSSVTSKVHKQFVNLGDGLKKPMLSIDATQGRLFPPPGDMGPVLAPFPVVSSTDHDKLVLEVKRVVQIPRPSRHTEQQQQQQQQDQPRSTTYDDDKVAACKGFENVRVNPSTRDTVDKSWKEFCTRDADASGFISASELQPALSEIMGKPVSLSRTRKALRTLDQDGSGNLDFYEFLAMVHQVRSGARTCIVS